MHNVPYAQCSLYTMYRTMLQVLLYSPSVPETHWRGHLLAPLQLHSLWEEPPRHHRLNDSSAATYQPEACTSASRADSETATSGEASFNPATIGRGPGVPFRHRLYTRLAEAWRERGENRHLARAQGCPGQLGGARVDRPPARQPQHAPQRAPSPQTSAICGLCHSRFHIITEPNHSSERSAATEVLLLRIIG